MLFKKKTKKTPKIEHNAQLKGKYTKDQKLQTFHFELREKKINGFNQTEAIGTYPSHHFAIGIPIPQILTFPSKPLDGKHAILHRLCSACNCFPPDSWWFKQNYSDFKGNAVFLTHLSPKKNITVYYYRKRKYVRKKNCVQKYSTMAC